MSTVPFSAVITPSGNFPAIDAQYMHGGPRYCASDAARDAIPNPALLPEADSNFRREGMCVYVAASASNGGAPTTYQLQGGITNAHWAIFGAGGGGGGTENLDFISFGASPPAEGRIRCDAMPNTGTIINAFTTEGEIHCLSANKWGDLIIGDNADEDGTNQPWYTFIRARDTVFVEVGTGSVEVSDGNVQLTADGIQISGGGTYLHMNDSGGFMGTAGGASVFRLVHSELDFVAFGSDPAATGYLRLTHIGVEEEVSYTPLVTVADPFLGTDVSLLTFQTVLPYGSSIYFGNPSGGAAGTYPFIRLRDTGTLQLTGNYVGMYASSEINVESSGEITFNSYGGEVSFITDGDGSILFEGPILWLTASDTIDLTSAGNIQMYASANATLLATRQVDIQAGAGYPLRLTVGTGGTIELNGVVAATSATAGGATALPATPAGYATLTINGTPRKLPYY